MPFYDDDTLDKIVVLRGLRALGTPIEVHELLKVEWPEPDGTIYYACEQVDETTSVTLPVSPVETRIIPSDTDGKWFTELSIDSTIGDEEIDLEIWDADEAIATLMLTHGEGVKVSVIGWFPQAELLLTHWHGRLLLGDEETVDKIKLKAVQGFHAADTLVPGRGHYRECQNPFGALFATDEAAIEGTNCNYDLHRGGSIGTNDPDTGLPWTFCPRRTTADCVTRGVNPLRHLSHATQLGILTPNNQTHGPNLNSVSEGNETNLEKPVRVVMGTRRMYGMKVMAFRRDLNNNNPAHGFFGALYEGPEGTIAGFSSVKIKVGGGEQSAIAIHYSDRNGLPEQPTLDPSFGTHGWSSTAYFRYIFGWVNPAEVDPNDAEASALVKGLNDIRVYIDRSAGAGLIGEYFSDEAWTDLVGTRIDNEIFFPLSYTPPLAALPNHPFSIKWTGKITARYTETYTFTVNVDDSVIVNINGTEVINASASGTYTGTIALTANVPVDIEVKFIQGNAPGNHPWTCVLYWASSSQATQIVPASQFSHEEIDDDSYVKQYTTNRVWQIARAMTDKRWGFGYDYARLNVRSWAEAASWAGKWVRYTDAFGDVWDHVRSESHVELIGKKAQRQIEDLCMAGRLSRPFLFNGEIHIVPLRALTDDELAACPVFTDEGDDPNIIVEGEVGDERSTLKISRVSGLDLTPRVECTFDDITTGYQEQPLRPIEDVDAELAFGRIAGDQSRKKEATKHALLGVVHQAQAIKLAWSILDLGTCDDGGLRNNCRVKMQIWFADALDLHMEKVIKVESAKLTKYGFTYFRIKKLQRKSDLTFDVEAQAYNETYMATFEEEIAPVVVGVEPPIELPPCRPGFGTVTYENGILSIPVPPC